MLVTPSPILKTELLPAKSHSDLGNCSRAWCAQKACERVRKALAIKQVLKDPLDWLAITPPAPKFSLSQELSLNASKKKPVLTSRSRAPLSCTAENKFLQGCNNQLRDVKQLLLYPYK